MGNQFAPVTWVHFVPTSEVPAPDALGKQHRVDRYRILKVRSIQGEAPTLPQAQKGLARIETQSLFTPPEENVKGNYFRGAIQHLNYTGCAEQRTLQAHSRTQLDPEREATAVLILVGKSAAWWRLSQEERQVLFRETPRHESHIGIGQRYADRIYRKLYHSRYVDPSAPYDFITYFEFEEDQAQEFRSMLSELRDARKNPEWLYVDYECEIWMKRLAAQPS